MIIGHKLIQNLSRFSEKEIIKKMIIFFIELQNFDKINPFII